MVYDEVLVEATNSNCPVERLQSSRVGPRKREQDVFLNMLNLLATHLRGSKRRKKNRGENTQQLRVR